MAEPKRPIDWEAVEREYRAGQLSVSEIGRTYGLTEGAIRKRAKRDCWQRDLTDRVRSAVRAELVRDGTNSERADEELIREKAATGAYIVREHRGDISRLRRISATLGDRLERRLVSGPNNEECVGAKESLSDVLEKLSRVSTRVVQLERQAFNLDEGAPEGDLPAPALVDGRRRAALALLLAKS